MEEQSEWEAWISRMDLAEGKTSYDFIVELVISSYELNKRNRKAELKDRVQFFCQWWFKHKKYMKYYTSTTKVADALGLDNHTSVLHHINHRKPSLNYDINTRCIADFLNS